MAFNVSDAVEPLEYDFTAFGEKIPALADAKGVIDEPSDESVQRMQRRLQRSTQKFLPDNVDMTNPADVARAMANLPESTFADAENEIVEAIAELCNGTPSRDQLFALPYRHKRKFIQWLQRQLMNPES